MYLQKTKIINLYGKIYHLNKNKFLMTLGIMFMIMLVASNHNAKNCKFLCSGN